MEDAELTLEGKVIVFKILAISKIVYLSMTIKVQTKKIVEFEKILKRFILKERLKNETIYFHFKDGGPKVLKCRYK